MRLFIFFFFQAEDGIRDRNVTGVQTCALPISKVSATFDASEIETTNDAFDPEAAAVRSEHHTTEQNQQDSAGASGVAGAVANQPGAGAPGGGGANRGVSNREDETKNYEISKTV